MKKLCAMIGLLLFSSMPALAQEKATTLEGFGGYSFVRLRATDLETNLHGWNGQIAVNPTSWFGIVADGGGYYASPSVQGTPVNIRIYSYMFGPRLSYRKHKGVTPFVHALFGQARLEVTVPSVPQANIPVSTGFAMAVGGGVDVKLTGHVALRVSQVEWLRTELSDQTQNNLRFSTGIVFRFGKR